MKIINIKLINIVLKNLKSGLLFGFLSLTFSSFADLTALSDDALAEQVGQALFKIEESQSTIAGQEDISFTRMTMGLKIEMNVTIDELSLGTFYRQAGNTCSVGGRFCDNTDVTDNYNAWNCTTSTCGGITDDHGNNPNSASAVVYGDLLELTTSEKGAATWGSLTGDHYASSKPFTDSHIFPSGFERTPGTDLRLRDVTFGRVIEHTDGTQTLEDFVIEKPFVEFAYDNSTGVKQISGLRIGFGSSTGVQGNAIDVLSGFAQPVITANAKAELIGLKGEADFTFAPYLGGVRTTGYIHPTKTIAGACTPSGIIGGIVCGKVETGEKIAEASPQSQLFPLQAISMDDAPTVWLSVQSKDVTYESDTVNGFTYNYETAKAGVWFNLGALSVYEGGRRLDITELSAATGVTANTQQPKHPDNYFSAHPNNIKYPNANNYY
ncbi:MAG: hypothetical protein JKY50_16550 [Oleispira sp.]|nr:hypothetical protein [Oleispira sp.]MBL4882607.1 hypothetical protein [Oleispira sp.]